MKSYVFTNGTVGSENLTGAEIKRFEKTYGRLIKIVINGQIYPLKYRDTMKPIEEHSWYKRREEQRKNAKNR